MRVIIVGAGEVGYHTARWLARENVDVSVIDTNAERIKKLQETLDIKAVLGGGSDPEVLERAGASGAEMMIAVTSIDEVNMISCLLAGVQFGIPTKIARIRNRAYTRNPSLQLKEHLGIDFSITPEVEVANKIIQLFKVPAASDLIEFADGKVQLIGLKVDKGSPVLNVKLKKLAISVVEEPHIIVAILRNDRVLIPRGEDAIQGGDTIYVMARAGEHGHLLKL